MLPNKLVIKLRNIEFSSKYHKKKCDRNVFYDKEIYQKYFNSKKILLVDDSMDYGYSVIETKKTLKNFFLNSEIKVAVFNVMKRSEVRPDFYLFEDTIINGPWSIDSNDYYNYMNLYKNWRKKLNNS